MQRWQNSTEVVLSHLHRMNVPQLYTDNMAAAKHALDNTDVADVIVTPRIDLPD